LIRLEARLVLAGVRHETVPAYATHHAARHRTMLRPPILRQSRWHMSAHLVVPETAANASRFGDITIVALPAKCPELNPQENVWQFMRDNWLSNRMFTSYENLVDHCCAAWNKLIDQPWTIMSIGLRDWAHGS